LPRDFDARKRYPVIVSIYDKQTDGIWNTFRPVDDDATNHGYAVFLPDIHYTIGKTGRDALRTIVSGARHLAELPFIDSTKMGLMGGSFGGYETNFIATHSSIFAAVIAASGATDLLSLYGSEESDEVGWSHSAYIEVGQARIGVTPWERPDLIIADSPIIGARNVTTPLLIMHSDDDNRVPYNQPMELFKALRRLGKPAWLLTFSCGHTCAQPWFNAWSDDTHSSIYMRQFFDHYLKDRSAPRWMTQSIPAELQGSDRDMEVDGNAMNPPPGGLLMDDEAKTPQQSKLLRYRE
jgi:dipeptidyl aminopeptidase/acylaminoacyl peptidase